MRFWKFPLFYFGVIAVCLSLTFFFFISQDQESFSLKRDVLDKTQYLFAESKDFGRALDLNITSNTVLEPVAPAFLVSGKVLGALGEVPEKKEVEEYVVLKGDNLTSIAEKFGISLETLLWANNLSSNSLLKIGQKLVILPVSGILHIVREGDTLGEIAQIYQADMEALIEFNMLIDEARIYAGDFLIIPGGKKPKNLQKYVQVPLSQSYFICPIPSLCRITQGLHWFNAVDFGNGGCGEPVFAAAGGQVQRTGYFNISGYYVRILHANGVVTFYGHLSRIAVSPGQKVYQGQIVGYVGHSGLTVPRGSAGCHLHFDVRFAKNPFASYPAGTELGN